MLRTIRNVFMLIVFVDLMGCFSSGNDIINPLLDDSAFTNFVPTVVTNQMIINTNISIIEVK